MGTGRIIVTGGAGFIGSHLVEALNRRGWTDILIVDQLGRDAKWRNLSGLQVAEVLQRDAFRQALQADRVPAADAVFHFGACSSTTEADTGYLLDTNYRYSVELCEWCLRHGMRFIYASSAATYGDGAQGYADTDAVTPTLRPLTPYGFSKHLFDLWALRQGHLQTIVGLKFFNVYGPRETHKGDMRSLVHKAVEQLRATGELCLFKSHRPEYRDGEQVRDFVWVDDAVQVALFFLAHPAVSGLFNCGTGQGRTWLDLARAVGKALGAEPRIRFIDMPEELRPRYQYCTVADLRKLRTAGYGAAFTSVEEGVGATVQAVMTGVHGYV
jgi:ADP-L-glycero-D-manno-heptose 6-epimerase